MTASVFDKKFGADFIGSVPACPGVYRYWGSDGNVLYVGKAKNLRRRLSNYRNATRRKVHRKMRTLVRLASRLDYEELSSEEAALLREGELIRSLRPPHNVEGAYSFLYPCVGVGSWDKHLLICMTTQPEAYRELELSWYGCFRSRLRVKAAFEALVALLGLIGHREKRTRLPPGPALRGSRLVGFRQVPVSVRESLPWFLAGEDRALPGELARLLLRRPRACREAADVEEHLKMLMLFFQQDAVRLRGALRTLGKPGSYVSQDERDSLFVRAGFAESGADEPSDLDAS
jgi:excinuclease ABC subunit C